MGNRTRQVIQALLDASGDTLKTPIKDLAPEVVGEILYGSKEHVWVPGRAGTSGSHVNWEGVIATIESAAERSNSIPLRRWARRFMQKKTCPSCEGTRLKPISLQFKLGGKNIADWGNWIWPHLPSGSNPWIAAHRQAACHLKEPLKEVNARLGFLVDVGLDYWPLTDLPAPCPVARPSAFGSRRKSEVG